MNYIPFTSIVFRWREKSLQRAEREALIHQTERLCVSEKACNNAVLDRLGLSIQLATYLYLSPQLVPDVGLNSLFQDGGSDLFQLYLL